MTQITPVTAPVLPSSRQTFFAPEWMHDSRQRVRIAVIGAGGTGGEVLDHLCRLHATLVALDHPGLHVTLLDGDTVSTSNVGRQRFSPMDVGANKAASLINRINLFYGLDWEGVPLYWTPDHSLPNFTISATDSAAVRHQIAAYGREAGNNRFAFRPVSGSTNLWLDFGNGEHDGQAILGHLQTDTAKDQVRLPHVIDLYPDMQDDPNDGPSCSVEEAIRQQAFGVNSALVSNAFATLVWPLFRKGQIDRHGLFMDVNEGSVNPLHVDPVAWELMGYTPAQGSAPRSHASSMS